jgi:hypothetical protein
LLPTGVHCCANAGAPGHSTAAISADEFISAAMCKRVRVLPDPCLVSTVALSPFRQPDAATQTRRRSMPTMRRHARPYGLGHEIVR